MTRLTDGNATHRQLPTSNDTQSNVLRPTAVLQPAVNVAAPTSLGDRDRVSNERTTVADLPGRVATGLPGEGEPEGEASDHLPRLGDQWATVFGNHDGETTNRLMRRIAIIEATRNELESGRGTGETTGANSLPAGELTLNGDGSITTPGGYTVLNDGGHNWRIREPSGQEHRIWGDPHVDENNDGRDDWHFNRDASFILPDGSKVYCNTSKVGDYGGAAVTLSDQLHVQYGASLGTMDVRNGGPGTLSNNGETFDHRNADGQIFVLANDSRFVAGNSLGDLYDRGGDFTADINASQRGVISDNARIALSLSRESGPMRSARDYREMREESGVGLPRLTTLSEGVQNVYANTTTRRREDEETVDDVVQKPKRQVSGVGST